MTVPFQSLAQRHEVQLGSSSYLVRNRVEYELPLETALLARSPTPAVVISIFNSPISLEFIEETFSRFEAEDDVFNEHFTTGGLLIIQHSSEQQPSPILPGDVNEYFNARSTRILTLDNSIPEGPYFVLGQSLHQAWRLYLDSLSAFATAVLPADEQESEDAIRYQHFHAADLIYSTSGVPVPSRLYYKKTAAQPLAGVRVTIKDNMHLAGVTTGLGNRAYAELYDKQEVTSKYVRSFIEKRAIIMGKTKLSAFAGSEIPPNQCIDYFPPWNPRGFGYQGPSGSSSGAAASIAGYPWVDVALCTDTTGSLRHPASSHGTWGHRITWGAVSMENIVPAVPLYDNMGLLTRTPTLLQELLTAAGLITSIGKPNKLIYPTDWYPLANEGQQRMNEAFLSALESYLGIEHTKLSLKEEWSRTAPEDLRDISLDDFLDESAILVNGYFAYHTFDDFRREYPARFEKQPYVSPTHTALWERGEKITKKELDESLEKIRIFKDWFNRSIWNIGGDPDAATIMLVPQGRPGANYRDVVSMPAGGPNSGSYTPIFTTPVIRCPQLVVPIGQNPYESRVSGLTEYAPIMASIIGPSNSDATLVEVVAKVLDKAGWPSTILNGRLMFTKGDNERNAELPPEREL